jgi:hypothetical protein
VGEGDALLLATIAAVQEAVLVIYDIWRCEAAKYFPSCRIEDVPPSETNPAPAASAGAISGPRRHPFFGASCGCSQA